MSLRSAVTVTTIGLVCKAFIKTGWASLSVEGLHHLQDALNDKSRDSGRGVITVSNHISTLDDPVAWTSLPTNHYWRSRYMRYVLGAHDIMFTNPVFSSFFRSGQVIETFRGNGVFQPAVDLAITKLNQGNWVHLFGEGKVNQPKRQYETDTLGNARLPRFKWGVGRMISATSQVPTIIPMWLTGFDNVMPEGRSFPFKYFPKPGAKLTVTFGSPLSSAEFEGVISRIQNTPELSAVDMEKEIRLELTNIVHRAVENLGRRVSGSSLKGHTR